jgi:hypothetical protein
MIVPTILGKNYGALLESRVVDQCGGARDGVTG